MTASFFEKPILNSPYEYPGHHWELDEDGQPTNRIIDNRRRFNKGEITNEELIETTVRLGFQNVIDAFHVVNQQTIAERFFIDERKAHNGIRITDQFCRLLETSQQLSFPQEIEARWRWCE